MLLVKHHPTLRDMQTDANALSSLAADYARGMTSIRGRRVQRLLKREFAGAAYVLVVEVATVGNAVLGLSESGAGFVATDGRGRQVSVIKWLHGSRTATEIQFDLLRTPCPSWEPEPSHSPAYRGELMCTFPQAPCCLKPATWYRSHFKRWHDQSRKRAAERVGA